MNMTDSEARAKGLAARSMLAPTPGEDPDKGHTKAITCLWLGQGIVATGSVDRTVRIWHIRSGLATRVLRGHKGTTKSSQTSTLAHTPAHQWPGTVWAVSGSSDQRFVVSASADLTNRVWDIIAGACLKVIRAHQETVKSVAIDLSTVITGGADGLIGVWAFKPPVMQPPRKKQRRQRNDDGPPPKSLGDPMVGTCPGFLYGLRDTRAVCALRW